MHFLNQCYNPCAHLPLIPILPLFDFMAAFPSVIHEWIFLCLRHRGFPIGFINFILAIYHQASAFAFINGRLQFLFPFLSGVLQGCPASAFLFNSSLDPFLNHFSEIVRTRSGILRVCADDVGAALRTLRCLRLLFPVFQCAQDLAGLTLKPVKCVIVPLVPFSEEVVLGIQGWLANHIPAWRHFSIRPTAKYLVFLWDLQQAVYNG